MCPTVYEGLQPYPNVLFLSTSIGLAVRIICPYCNLEKDVTNYDVW